MGDPAIAWDFHLCRLMLLLPYGGPLATAQLGTLSRSRAFRLHGCALCAGTARSLSRCLLLALASQPGLYQSAALAHWATRGWM